MRNEKGLSLIELIITLLIVSLLLGSIYGILQGTFGVWLHGSEKMDLQQNARIAMNTLENEIKRADRVNSNSTSTSLNLTIDGQLVRYHLSGTQLLRATTGGGNNPVAYNLRQLSFTYYPSVSSCSLVLIYMVFESQGYEYSITSKINVRAAGF